MKKAIFAVIITIIIAMTCSCYDSTEVDDMIYVLAIGIDDNGNNQQYIFQTAVPLNISSGVETGFASSEESATLQNIKVSAPNLYSAINLANQKVTKEVNISHCKLIVFSKKLAQKGLESQLKAVLQSPELRPSVLVAITKGKTENYLNNISSPFELNPARYYNMFFAKDDSPQSFTAVLNDFEKSNIVAVPLIDENNTINTSVVKDFKESGVLDNEETVALNMLTGNYKSGYITVDNNLPAINLNQDSPPKIHIKTDKSNPVIDFSLNFYGTQTEPIDDVSLLDTKIKEYIKTSCENLLNKSKGKLNADIINIGSRAKKNFLTLNDFNEFNWAEKYKNAQFNVNVNYRTIR